MNSTPPCFSVQIEVAEDLPLYADGDAQKGPHRRVVGRKAAGAGVVGQVREAYRARVVDERSEEPAVAVGEPSDELRRLRVDPVEDEVRERLAVLGDDADRRVAGVGEFGGRLADAVEGGVQFQTGAHGAHRFEQLRHPRGQLGGQSLEPARRLRRRLQRVGGVPLAVGRWGGAGHRCS